MKTAFLAQLFAGILGCLGTASGAIVYFNGPALPISSDWTDVAMLDLDQDGQADFSFFGGPTLTTASFPDSMTTPFYGACLNSNAVLCQGVSAVLLSAGQWIGDTTPSNAVWTVVSNGVLLASFYQESGGVIFTSQGFVTNAPSQSWGGPLAAAGGGYLAVHFQAADGWHYGWIHAVLEDAPTIVDWAYESQPETPIAAGAVPLARLQSPRVVRTDSLRLQWQAQSNAAYQVQSKSDLNTVSWSNLDFTVIATGDTCALEVPLNESAGFFRVVQTQ
jgi:hypothetical protein